MKKFEYKIALFSQETTSDDIVSRLNAFGEQGWEVVVVTDAHTCIYLKREMPPSGEEIKCPNMF